MKYFLLLFLAATVALLLPCLYSFLEPGKEFEVAMESEVLNTHTIEKFLSHYPEYYDRIDSGQFTIRVKAVCKLNGDRDYYIYQVPKYTLMTANSYLHSMTQTALQHNLMHQKDFLIVDFTISNYIPGISYFNTVALSKSLYSNSVHRVHGPQQMLDLLGIDFSTSCEAALSPENDTQSRKLGLPKHCNCVFRNKAEGIKYFLESTGSAYLVQADPKKNDRKLVCSTDRSASCSDLFRPAPPGPLAKEKRVYVDSKENSVTSIKWTQDELKYWVTVLSTNYEYAELADMLNADASHTEAEPEPRRRAKVPISRGSSLSKKAKSMLSLTKNT